MDKETEKYLIFNFIFIVDTITDRTTTTILTNQKPVHRNKMKNNIKMLTSLWMVKIWVSFSSSFLQLQSFYNEQVLCL